MINEVASRIIDEALNEDAVDFTGKIPPGDHSSLACIPQHKEGQAHLLCKAEGVLAGVALAEVICQKVDSGIVFEKLMEDGALIKKGDIAFVLRGEVKSILRAERVLLNFMQRMSGIATNTSHYVQRVSHTSAKILDTRKTTPGLRYFEKWAVRIGGGHNHRYGLYDMIMLKDNHIDFCGGITKAIQAVVKYQEEHQLHLPVEVETRTLRDVEEVLQTGNVTRIMFDNFSPELMVQAVKLVNRAFETEASGGINLDTVARYAETGVDYISVGALTHSSGSLDLSLKAF
ncbi:MAG: carboxylating nicotinate-nucleotide diphosphorylase [Bacteroidetes bacterium]|nr:carboxylating nicotinate-nucleotide diphosphorylase [Bacteroidota bacterium]